MTKYPTSPIAVYDLEVFPDWFLAGFQLPDGTFYQYEFSLNTGPELGANLRYFLNWIRTSGHVLAGFNSRGYDDPVLTEFLLRLDPNDAYRTSVRIIQDGVKGWSLENEIWSIDLMQILPGRIGLKKIGVCLGHSKLQELPIPFDRTPTEDEKQALRDYNRNDLIITRKLLDEIQPELDLRGHMSEIYDVDMRSKGEATMAEVAILEEFRRRGGTMTKQQLNAEGIRTITHDPQVKVTRPSWWKGFDLETYPELFQVAAIGETIFATPVPININNLQLSSGFLNRQLFIGDRYYTMGVGGLHSVDGPGCWIPKDDEFLVDIDVASYYPNIVLTQELEPRQWGEAFLPIYRDIVERRLKAKREGDKVTAQILKISANGTYGKTSDVYSSLYDPQVTVNVTVLGQLGLLVLIAMLDGVANVVSANTDGITVLLKKDRDDALRAIVREWERLTSLEMEFTGYAALYQKDVNNYVALTTAGKLKTKGRFVADWPDLRHTPNANIIATAIQKRVRDGKPIENTIYECRDINQFVLTQSVTGSWTTSWRGQRLGKMLRFYKSNHPDSAPITRSPGPGDKGNKGIVANSDGCIPLVDLPNEFPRDVNHAWYIEEANKLWKVISQPKTPGMNRWAEVLHKTGLRPCYVAPDADIRSRARVEYGTQDFTSKPSGWVMGTGTGDGLLAVVYDDRVTVHLVNDPYPGKTRAKVKRDHGFELVYGARVPLTGCPFYGVTRESDVLFDDYYTPAELKKVGR